MQPNAGQARVELGLIWLMSTSIVLTYIVKGHDQPILLPPLIFMHLGGSNIKLAFIEMLYSVLFHDPKVGNKTHMFK